MNLLDDIERWSRTHSDRLVHVSDEHRLTYGELSARSSALAAWIDRELADRHVPVAIHGHKEPEMLVTFLAAVKTGRPYIPLDHSAPPARVQRVMEISGAGMLLTPARVAKIVGEVGTVDYKATRLAHDDPFYILFTSGSTGEPKGVVITLANLTHFVTWMRSEHAFRPAGEIFLNHAPFTFDLSVLDLYVGMTTGGTLFSLTKDLMTDLRRLFEALRASGITVWTTTPSFAQLCLIERSFSSAMLPDLRRFLFCGETLPHDTAAQLLERFPGVELWNTYGPTEATVATTSIRITPEVLAKWNPLPIGRQMPGTRVFIRGEDWREIAPGERGEITIAGPNVSPGYLARPDLTARAFGECDGQRSYRTGDWGRERDGLLFCEGRMDFQIKLHGYRIELGDLEANLRALPEIADAVVLPVEKGGKIDSLAACVVLRGAKEGSDFEQSAKLKTKLGERVPAYMVPRKFHYFESFPLNDNGKADRKQLKARIGA
jgi:D-alanine--poly(phosphoribitol) ligase subunit 1